MDHYFLDTQYEIQICYGFPDAGGDERVEERLPSQHVHDARNLARMTAKNIYFNTLRVNTQYQCWGFRKQKRRRGINADPGPKAPNKEMIIVYNVLFLGKMPSKDEFENT